MIDLIKQQYKKVLLCVSYIILACVIYGVWFWQLWNLWYPPLLIVITIILIGITISYFWIKSGIKKEESEEIKKEILDEGNK